MENKKIKPDLATLALTVALVAIMFCANAISVTNAQDPAQQPSTPTTTDTEPANEVICQYEMRVFIAEESNKYNQFINTHFENKSSTGSLLDTAFAKYDEYRTLLFNKYYTYLPKVGADMSLESIKSGSCLAQVTTALDDAMQILMRKAQTTSAVKKTTALMDKYKEINDKLAVMNKSFANFKSYMDKFSLKVPCYIKDKCNAG